MNLVSLLIATSVVKYADNTGLRVGVALAAVIIIVGAILFSKRRGSGMGDGDGTSTEVAGSVDAIASAPEAPAPAATEAVEIVEIRETVTPEVPGGANGQGPSTVPKAPGTDS
jgi:K(+)-stimulated pyrophosphate-energized sodium pump